MKNDGQIKATSHGDFERRDIGIGGVLYFIVILAVVCMIAAFLVNGLYRYLEKRTESQQPPVSPLVTNAPKDTRRLTTSYQDYLKQNFPSPQLEINERDQLNQIRTTEDQMLATYGWVDQNAGTVHIPIDRAMDLIAQRGLPLRGQNTGETTAASVTQNTKGNSKGTRK